ncbi:MAG: hypothetical protein ABI224_00050 [Acetobacteraceae bacterium]
MFGAIAQPELDALARTHGEMKADARAAGLIDAELAAYNAERREERSVD